MPEGAPTDTELPVAAAPAPPPAAPEAPPPPDIAEPEPAPPAFSAQPAPASDFDAEPADPFFAATPPPEPASDPAPPEEPLFGTEPAAPAADPAPAAEPSIAPAAPPEADAPAGGRNIAAEFGTSNAPPEIPADPFPHLSGEQITEALPPIAATEADAVAQALADPPSLEREPPAPSISGAETQAAGPSPDAAMDGFPPPPVAPPDMLTNRNNAPPPQRHSGRAATVSLVILILLVSGLGAGAYLFQNNIVAWMPWSNSVYAMVGIQPDILGTGLQIIEPKPKKQIKGNDEILVVEGEIRNTSNKPLSLPLMRGALLGKDGAELHVWTFRADQAQIEPGELVGYKTEFRNPPGTAQKLDITFTRPGETGIAKNPPPVVNPSREPVVPPLK